MTLHRLRVAPLFVVVLGAATLAGDARSIAGQQPAGMLASWGDMETWSRHDERTDEGESGLGLQLQGPTGTMLLSFSARFPGKVALRAPDAVVIQAAVTPSANPNVLRTPTLVFLLDVKTPRAATMDVSQRMSVDAPGPGQVVSNGRASISPEEYLRLVGATTLNAKVLGLDVEFRREQLRAMRDFGERLNIRPKGKTNFRY